MDVLEYLENKSLWCEKNRDDQSQLGNETSANFWHGRALSFQEIAGALTDGIVTPEGITRLDLTIAQ